MEVPRLGVKSELQLPAYTKATAMWDLSHVWDPHHSSGQCWILNPGVEPASSWILVGFITAEPWQELCDLILSLSMFSRFIHMVACISTSFLLLPNNIPLYGYTTFYLTICQLMSCFHFLVIMNNAAMNILCTSFVRHMFSFLLGIYLGVKILSHMITLCLKLWGTARLFSKVAATFYIPISNAWGEGNWRENTEGRHWLVPVQEQLN